MQDINTEPEKTSESWVAYKIFKYFQQLAQVFLRAL